MRSDSSPPAIKVSASLCPCSGLIPPCAGFSTSRRPCPASLPCPVRMPVRPDAPLRPLLFPSPEARPAEHPQTVQAAACPFLAPFRRSRPGITHVLPSAAGRLSSVFPSARPTRRAVLFLFRPQRRKHFCRLRPKVLPFAFIINKLVVNPTKSSLFFLKNSKSPQRQKRKHFLL